jgi:hypothetical protein
MRADDFLTEGGLVSFLKKFGADAVDYAAGKAPKVKNWVDTNPQGGLLGGRVPGKPDDVTHVYRNMSPEELEAAKKSGYFDKNPNPDPNIKWDTDKKYWSQGDADDYFGRAWKDSPDNAKVRMPAEKLPRWTAGQTGNAEVLDKATGTWNPVKENLHDEPALEDRHPNDRPYGPETKPTMPAGTVRVDVSDVYDWYKLGMHISDLEGLGKHDFGKGPPSTIFSFGSEEQEHEYLKNLEKTGLTTTDIDPVDLNQPPGMPRQKTDPTFNVNEGAEQDYLSQIPNLSWKPVSRSVWNTIQDEGLDEEQDAPRHTDWVMASLSIDPTDAQALQAFDSDAIEDFNRFDIYLKSRYPGLTDLIDYDNGTVTIVKPANMQGVTENFADGKVKGRSRPGRVKRAGASCNGSVTDLRARAKNASGERAKMYHWCANMKSGRNKNK